MSYIRSGDFIISDKPEISPISIVMLMKWRNEKEKEGNKRAARAIQRIIDKHLGDSLNEYLQAYIFQDNSGIKINGW